MRPDDDGWHFDRMGSMSRLKAGDHANLGKFNVLMDMVGFLAFFVDLWYPDHAVHIEDVLAT